MNKNKKDDVLEGLKGIARTRGEEEDDTISELKEYYDIDITEEEVTSLRGGDLWMYVIKPFKEDEYDKEKELFKNKIPSVNIGDYIKKIEKNGKFYIKYPEYVDIRRIQNKISEDLKEKYRIDEEHEDINWDKIFSSKEWKVAEIQVARELIGIRLKYLKTRRILIE